MQHRFPEESAVELTFDGETVRGGPDAREQFYDARGYGRPRDGDVEFDPVEAAHLLFRGDVSTLVDGRPDAPAGDTLDFRTLLTTDAVSEVAFFVYADLRKRGFYCSPVGDPGGGTDEAATRPSHHEFEVYPRGLGPWDESVAYRIRAVSERETVEASGLQALRDSTRAGAGTGAPVATLAVVDEESEVTYLEVGDPDLEGSTYPDLPAIDGTLLSDRVLVLDPPDSVYERGFYGQPLDPDGPLQLSLVEAAHLVDTGVLTLAGETSGPTDSQRVVERGRTVEGERFDRRLRVYSTLRTAGIVPKTGFKFGADFRTYADVTSVEDLGHSELLVRVLPADHTFDPRDLALDVRLAHGVRKRMGYALVDEDSVSWVSLQRLTP